MSEASTARAVRSTESEGEQLKGRVRDYWDQQTCGTQNTQQTKFTRAYFDEIEEHRYRVEPEIFSFAQFTRHRGEKMLEVGVGAGSDFLQWVRAGAQAHGIDLTPQAIEHVRHRLSLYGLEAADLRVADCENLPFPDHTFDLVYSWGVIHHTPNTPRALAEIVRVTRPGGTVKLMLYHRHSLVGFYQWMKWALLRGRPWKSVRWCFANQVESPGTQAFTIPEVRAMLRGLPVAEVQLRPVLTHQDRLLEHAAPARWFARVLTGIVGERAGFYLTIRFRKRDAGGPA